MTRTSTTIAATLVLAAGSAMANPYGFYASENNQQWGRTQFPDFDQKRLAIFDIPGLPNGGAMYCVPTATMNAFAYIARHGYPNIEPGSANWDPDNDDQYEDITLLLQQLGADMSTSPTGGTGADGWWDGTRAWLPANQFDLYQRFAISNHDTTTREIADIGRAGGIMVFCYGRWEHDGSTLTDRTGGHCVTPTEVDVDFAGHSELKYRNPSSSDSDFFQSDFSYTTMDVFDSDYTYEGETYTMSRINFNITDPDDDRLRLIDKIYCIFPKSGLTNWPSGNITKLAPNPVDPGNPIEDTIAIPGPVGGCKLGPARTYGALVYTPPGGQPQVARFGDSSGALTFVGPCDADSPIEFCRRGYLNLLSGNELIQYDIDDRPVEVGRVQLPVDAAGGPLCTPKDMAYDDENDLIVILCDTQILLYGHDLSGPEIRPLPASTHFGDFLAIHPGTSDPVVGNSSGHYTQMAWADTRYIPGASHQLPSGSTLSSLSMDDAGTVFTVVDGLVQAFEPDATGNGFVPDPDAPFVGQPAGSTFQISRSRTNYDARVHRLPGWNEDIDPAELVDAPETLDCDADFNLDGVADINDLLAYLAAWFAGEAVADLNVDTEVDINDLLFFLAAWFNGCPTP